MTATATITAVSPVPRLLLNASNALNVTMGEADTMINPYTYVADDGLKRIREDAPIPDWLLRAMRGDS